jgi:flagellar M-ring protein FliF
VGNGNAIVRVNAELDFKQVQRTIEQYDPNTVVRSEQNMQEKTMISDSLPPSSRNNQVTNYEIGKTIEHVVDNVGSVKRLSVAVLVNDVIKVIEKDGKQVPEYKPRPAEQMTQLTELVKQVVGFDDQRKDQISVQNITFDAKPEQEFQTKETPLVQDVEQYVDKIVIAVAMIVGMLVLRSLVNRLRSRRSDSFVPATRQREREVVKEASVETLQQVADRKRREIQVSNVFDPNAAEIPEELLVRNQMRQQVAGYVKEKPSEAIQLIKVWLNEDVM